MMRKRRQHLSTQIGSASGHVLSLFGSFPLLNPLAFLLDLLHPFFSRHFFFILDTQIALPCYSEALTLIHLVFKAGSESAP